jgi:hypothetical protein
MRDECGSPRCTCWRRRIPEPNEVVLAFLDDLLILERGRRSGTAANYFFSEYLRTRHLPCGYAGGISGRWVRPNPLGGSAGANGRDG